MKRALLVVLVLAGCGVAFSGVLVYRELFAGAAACGTAAGGTKILGLPVCVYGFAMFLAILVTAAAGVVAGGRDESQPLGEPATARG